MSARSQQLDLERELLEEFERCFRVSEYLVEVLPTEIWRAVPPAGKGRSIAAIVAHMQSVRRMFAKVGGADRLPPPLDRLRSTPGQALRGFEQTRQAFTRLFGDALAERRPRVKAMPRRMVNMMIYLVQHEAHHRGQICALARELGHRLSKDDIMRMWGWKSLPQR